VEERWQMEGGTEGPMYGCISDHHSRLPLSTLLPTFRILLLASPFWQKKMARKTRGISRGPEVAKQVSLYEETRVWLRDDNFLRGCVKIF
jgi:hypothetical protein